MFQVEILYSGQVELKQEKSKFANNKGEAQPVFSRMSSTVLFAAYIIDMYVPIF